jgi:CubicO group peptidase (beta-lactamase class C family)
MVRLFRLTLCALVACLLLSLSFVVSAQQTPTPAGFAATFDALAQKKMDDNHIPGMAVSFIHGGTVSDTRVYGMADVAANRPVTAETPFLVASLSKAVTAWAIMGLVEQGKIDLDAPAETYLTRWHFPPSTYDVSEVTIQRILSHTAGLSQSGYEGFPLGQPLPTLEQFLDGADGHPVEILLPPGTIHQYSGGGYTVLQLIVEEVADEPFTHYVERTVFAPLGMTHTTYTQTPLPTDTAIGYDYGSQPLPQRVHLDFAAGGLYTTAPDYATFIAAMMPGPDGALPGRGLLKSESVAQMQSPAPVRNESYGFGMYVVPLADGTISVWHDGQNPGYKTLFAAIPSLGEGMVIFTNAVRGDRLFDDLVCAWTETLPLDATKLCRAV